ncbi:MAG: ATP-binding protein, partial [Cyanobacteriota bacterium SKYGB_h_bin112]|nr:ATP-binding protein [Cyanobacteriota bacterium SKYGB_h_bin112]
AESIPQHVWTATPDGRLDCVNQRAIDYFGSAQLLDRSWQQFIHPEDLVTYNENWERAIVTHSQFETELRLRRASDQVYRWHIARALPMQDETGQIMRWFGTSTDINDQKQAEITLQKAAERERAIARITQQMRQTLDLKTIFASTTDELRHVIQCDRVLVYRFKPDWSGEVVYESVAPGWQVVIPPKPEQLKLLQSAVENADCIVKTLSGDEIVIQDTYLQETQGGFYTESGSYRCVTDIYAAGFDDCYLELLELLQARAYVTVPIFWGQYLWGLLAVYQNSGPRQWRESVIKIVTQTSNQLGVAVQQAELLAQTQQQAEDLRQAKEAADAANRAKSEFLANMSHELRTPLNAILGFAQLMAKDSTLSPEHQQYTDIINRSGEHLLKLINDILEMSKIEAGRTSLNESEFDLYALLDDLEEMLSLRATAKRLTLTFDRAADVPQYICSDESKLRQVLLNLLSNAIKFTSQGQVTMRVRVAQNGANLAPNRVNLDSDETASQPVTLHFEVEDTGAGIAPEEMARLFEAFTQTRTGIKASEGTGLGLPISQTFVRLMGGEITVTSQVGQGSLFAFDIQATLANAALVATTRYDQRQVIGLAPGQPTYRILIAEDIPTNRLLLVRLLSPLGFEIKEAENGQVALDIWRDWQPHVILMDMHMPVLDGYEATRYIKAAATSHDTVIIALTASAFEEQRRAILSAGCDDFVRKPFQACELLEKLSHHLGIVYEYAEASTDPSKSAVLGNGVISDSDNDRPLTAQCLTTMPSDWLDNLRHAAVLCSDVSVLQLIEQVPPEQSQIARGLSELVENFRFDRIQSLAEQALAQTTP